MTANNKESKFQSELIKSLKLRGWVVLKNDPNYIQGFPDLTVFLSPTRYTVLEVKRSANAPHRPNQDYWVEKCDGLFVYPENLDAVLYLLEEKAKYDHF